jgi:hypothetical protein
VRTHEESGRVRLFFCGKVKAFAYERLQMESAKSKSAAMVVANKKRAGPKSRHDSAIDQRYLPVPVRFETCGLPTALSLTCNVPV